MTGDMICLNGKLTRWGDSGLDPAYLAVCNFVYQKIHTISHKPLHSATHLELIDASYKILYGSETGLTATILAEDVSSLLSGNKFPSGSSVVMLYMIPPLGGSDTLPIRLLICEKQLLYGGYTLWHTSAKVVITPYECPFPHHKTAVSLAAHNYSVAYAASKKADVALTENYGGIITSVGEYPFFAIHGSNIFTTPVEEGATDSVERRLGIIASERAGRSVIELSVETSSLRDCEEMFYVTQQGVVSIGSLAGRPYPNSAAKAIAAVMSGLTGEEL